jgi:hypothetical protein
MSQLEFLNENVQVLNGREKEIAASGE